MASSVEEMGRPIEPLNGSSGGLMQAAGEVSVRPHACVRILPVTSFQRFATEAWTAIPPPSVICSWLKSTVSKPGVFNKALNNVLTPEMNVNGYFFNSLMTAGKSRGLMMSMFLHPNRQNNRQFAVKAKM